MGMPAYDKTNKGTFSKNDRKRPGKQDPDITGSLNVDGNWYWFNAWQKQDKDGKIFYSASVRAKEGGGVRVEDGATQSRNAANDNGAAEIPWE